MQPATGGVLADASWRSARRDKEASETKNMQTTALHASLTAHQTFIAWSHKRAVGTDDSWWLKSGGDREKGGEGTERAIGRGGRDEGEGGEKAAVEELPTVYTYIMQMVPIISEVYNRSINLLTGRKGSGELRVTIRGGFAASTNTTASRAYALANGGVHTTVDKCILLAYHLYAWSFVLSLALDLPPLALFRRNSLRRLTYGRLTIDSGKIEWHSLGRRRFLRLLTIRQLSNRKLTFKEQND